ncbi:putative protein-lysine deacylase ABHD14B isoform X2 [Tachypleus tridentatus]|uniref:putative protein-lysine deacylase ABHD14B isoform X2 n=1 Tax=Tachypleus tridentatus TaxID=6853 RepID=UPI003FD14C9C
MMFRINNLFLCQKKNLFVGIICLLLCCIWILMWIPHQTNHLNLKQLKKTWVSLPFFSKGTLNNDELEDYLESSIKLDKVPLKVFNLTIQDYRIYGIEALPLDGNKPKLDILLLHGASTFADSWRHLGTLQLLSLWGYHAVAIDLPGFGKSTMDNVLPEKRPDFLSELIWSLQMPQPLVVAPSLSNLFVLPHLSMYPEKILAAIIISPIIPSSMKAEDYVIIKASTLVISGDKDQKNNLKPAKALEKIPSCELRIFPHASSPAHQSQPKLFHKELFSFLQKFKHSCR